MWLMTENRDYVFYDSQTSRPHQEHIILHEIGHMLCGHDQGKQDTQLCRHIDVTDPDLVRRILPRIRYTNRQEQEAELVASLILTMIGCLSTPSPFTGVLASMESALGFRRKR
jgi:Zn-dependent peptidase ImmA (M78 family)